MKCWHISWYVLHKSFLTFLALKSNLKLTTYITHIWMLIGEQLFIWISNVGFSMLPKDTSTESNHRSYDWWTTAIPAETQQPPFWEMLCVFFFVVCENVVFCEILFFYSKQCELIKRSAVLFPQMSPNCFICEMSSQWREKWCFWGAAVVLWSAERQSEKK